MMERPGDYAARLARAFEAREDGELEDAAAILQALLADCPGDAAATLEYAALARKSDTPEAAETALLRAMAAHNANFELHAAWADIPIHHGDHEALVARGRLLRGLFPPPEHPKAWRSLAIELDSHFEAGRWAELAGLVDKHWPDFLRHAPILPDGIAALNKLFLTDRLAQLAAQASPAAFGHLPPETPENLRRRAAMAARNRELVKNSGTRIISLGQNCLPYQLAGRWGLIAEQADPAALMPFDLGGFHQDSAAAAIAADFRNFADHADYIIGRAWGGGKMFVHKPTNIGFFHERGAFWVTPDREKFHARLDTMIGNWQRHAHQGKRLFVFCYCGAGSLERLVEAAAAHLLGPDAKLLIVDVMKQPHYCPAHQYVSYRHVPYPDDYDWTSIFQQNTQAGWNFELSVITPVLELLEQPPAPKLDFTRDMLTKAVWSFGIRGGYPQTENFRFDPAGSIAGYQNDNEASWVFEDGRLKIFQRGGRLMWVSGAPFTDDLGRRAIALKTPFDENLIFVLTEMAAAAGPRVVILDNGLNIAGRLPKSLAGYEIVSIKDPAEIEKFSDCDIFCSGLVLTHARDAGEAKTFIETVTKRFALCVFFELSSFNAEYLRGLGLQSFHAGYRENRFMGQINLEFVAASAERIYKIEHFADVPAFDSYKNWVVSLDHPPGTFPTRASRGDYHVFDRPVFEISAFACHGFHAVDLPIADDLTLVEMRTLRFRAHAAGLSISDNSKPWEIGRLLYTTQENAPAALKNRTITLPQFFVDDPVYQNPAYAEAVRTWREQFKIDVADWSVHELRNCIAGGGGSIMSDGKYVWGTDYLLQYMHNSTLDPLLLGMQRRHKAVHVPGIAIMGYNYLYDNHYHFTAEALTSINLCAEILEQRGVKNFTVITGKLNPVRRQFLELLFKDRPGVKIVDLEREEFITADVLLYCNNLGPLVPPRVVLETAWLARRLIENAGLTDAKPGRLIYLARTDTKARVILNEQKLIERLAGLGFEIHTATGKPLVEQMRIFREAKFVVAPHGAGITNIIFAHPGTLLLELAQSTYQNTGMMRLAQAAGVRYYSELFFPENGGNADRSWVVDVERVAIAVEKMRQL
jgi:hypothetical protein